MRASLAVVALTVALAACSAPAPPQIATPSTAPTSDVTLEATAAPSAAQPTTAPTAARAPTSSPTPVAGSLVLAAVGGLSKTLHPYPDSASYSQAWLDVAALIWGGADGGGALLSFDWDSLDYRPAMAAQMPQVSSDGRTFTFMLRGSLKWSDGSPITADDFTFAFGQASREENHYVQLDLLQAIATYRAPAPNTVEVTLKNARTRDLALAIVNAVVPVPKRIWSGRAWADATANSEILRPSVVLGPFALEDVSGDRATFSAIDTFYLGKPSVPRFEILAIARPAEAYAVLKTGRANWLRSLVPSAYHEAKSDPALDVKEWTPANAAFRTLEFNLSRPFLSDKRVRQALALSVDRADLIARAEAGLAVPQYSFVQPTNQRWATTTGDRYDFDPARADKLLSDAGYSLVRGQRVGKDGQPVKLLVVYPTSSTARAAIASYLQQQYLQTGISVEVEGLDFNAYTERVLSHRDFDISLATYGGGSLDPDLGPKAQLISNGAQNVTGYSNPQVDDLFRQASLELDSTQRKQLYEQIQTLVNADVPSHYLYALKSVDVFSTRVHGVMTHSGERLDANSALLSWTVDS